MRKKNLIVPNKPLELPSLLLILGSIGLVILLLILCFGVVPSQQPPEETPTVTTQPHEYDTTLTVKEFSIFPVESNE